MAQNTVYIQSGSYIVYIYTHTYTCKTNYLYYTQWYEIILLHIYIYAIHILSYVSCILNIEIQQLPVKRPTTLLFAFPFVVKKKKTAPQGPLPPDYPVLKHGGGASDGCCCRKWLVGWLNRWRFWRLFAIFFSVVLGEIPTEPLAFFAGKPLTLVTFYGF